MNVLEKAKQEVEKIAKRKEKALFLNNYGLEDKDIENLMTYVFQLIPDLEILDLSHNKLTKLPPIMGEFKDLKSLIVNNNQLKVIEANITHLDNLKFLNFENNHIENVPENLNSFKQLNKLKIKGNPLSVEAKTLLKNTLGDNVFFDVIEESKKSYQDIEDKNNKPRKNSDNWSEYGIRKTVDEKVTFYRSMYLWTATKEQAEQLWNHPNPEAFLSDYFNKLLNKGNNLSPKEGHGAKNTVNRRGDIAERMGGGPLNVRKVSVQPKKDETSKGKTSSLAKTEEASKKSKGMFKKFGL